MQRTVGGDGRCRRAGSLSTLQSGTMEVEYTVEALGDVAQVLTFVANQSPSHVVL